MYVESPDVERWERGFHHLRKLHAPRKRGILLDMANRHQRRRWSAKFRQSKIESIPRPVEVTHQKDGTKTSRLTGAQGVPCDWPGCQTEWQFSTHATVGKVRKVVARRCGEHRLTSAPA